MSYEKPVNPQRFDKPVYGQPKLKKEQQERPAEKQREQRRAAVPSKRGKPAAAPAKWRENANVRFKPL